MTLESDLLSADVEISNNHVENIKCFTNEILATVLDGRVMNDVRGAVLQFYNGESYIGVTDVPDAVGKGKLCKSHTPEPCSTLEKHKLTTRPCNSKMLAM